jgi:hypothetical protein
VGKPPGHLLPKTKRVSGGAGAAAAPVKARSRVLLNQYISQVGRFQFRVIHR